MHAVEGIYTALEQVQVGGLQVIPIAHSKVQGSSAKSGHKVVDKKSLPAPAVFERSSKHPEGKHVTQNMPQVAGVVQKEVGDQLVGLKKFANRQVESELPQNVKAHAAKDNARKKGKSVDDKKVLNNRREKAEARGAVVHN